MVDPTNRFFDVASMVGHPLKVRLRAMGEDQSELSILPGETRIALRRWQTAWLANAARQAREEAEAGRAGTIALEVVGTPSWNIAFIFEPGLITLLCASGFARPEDDYGSDAASFPPEEAIKFELATRSALAEMDARSA